MTVRMGIKVLSRDQRNIVRSDTGINAFIIDRVADAYECLLRDDRAGYKQNMGNALAQLDLPIPIPQSERPTALDKVKTICIRSIADQWGWSFKRTARWLHEATSK